MNLPAASCGVSDVLPLLSSPLMGEDKGEGESYFSPLILTFSHRGEKELWGNL